MVLKRLLALLIIIYALVVVFVTVKKPEQIWNMKKVRGFRKVLGEKALTSSFMLLPQSQQPWACG